MDHSAAIRHWHTGDQDIDEPRCGPHPDDRGVAGHGLEAHLNAVHQCRLTDLMGFSFDEQMALHDYEHALMKRRAAAVAAAAVSESGVLDRFAEWADSQGVNVDGLVARYKERRS